MRGGSRRHGGKQLDSEPPGVSGRQRRDAEQLRPQLAAQRDNSRGKRRGGRPVSSLPDGGSSGEQGGELSVVSAGDAQDESGGLEADGERVVEADRGGSLEGGESSISRVADVASSKQRPRKNRPDQRHFPFDA